MKLIVSQVIDEPWMGYEFWFPKFKGPKISKFKVSFPTPETEDCTTCGFRDTFTRNVNPGWGTNETDYTWMAQNDFTGTGETSVDGSYGIETVYGTVGG